MTADPRRPTVVRNPGLAARPSVVRVPTPGMPRLVRIDPPDNPVRVGSPPPTGGFGYAMFAQSAAIAPMLIAPGIRTRIAFDVDPDISVDALNPPFRGHLFWRDNRLMPRHVDDTLILRLDLRAAGQVIGGRIDFKLDIGGTVGVIRAEHYDLTAPAGDFEAVTFDAPLFGRDTFTANGGAMYITCSVPTMIQRESIVVFPLSLRAGGG